MTLWMPGDPTGLCRRLPFLCKKAPPMPDSDPLTEPEIRALRADTRRRLLRLRTRAIETVSDLLSSDSDTARMQAARLVLDVLDDLEAPSPLAEALRESDLNGDP